jgi:arogenate dehydrogenase (NADP+)
MKIGIVGLGLIGGCLGFDLRQLGHQVYGVGRRAHICQAALAAGALDQASTDLSLLQTTDVVFVCTPMAAILPTIQQLAMLLTPETVITDVGSVKGTIVQAATQLWPRFVGAHPMSGKAEAGFAAAQRDLFVDNPYVITPMETSDAHAVAMVDELARAVKSQLFYCSPEDHDRAVAWISHLPVMVSASLIQTCLQESDATVAQLAKNLASSGFRDTSRVGGGNPELGVMMAQFNRSALLHALGNYRQQIDHLTHLIETQDWATLEKTLLENQTCRPGFLVEHRG